MSDPEQPKANAPNNVDPSHVQEDGRIVDPLVDQDPKNWHVRADPPPDVASVVFWNPAIGYAGYDPPKGFTAEALLAFNGAEDCLTLGKAEQLIAQRDRLGTLNLRGDARWR